VQPSEPNHEEFVQVLTHDGEELGPLQQGVLLSYCFPQNCKMNRSRPRSRIM
jgi:hypothetical protein